MAQFAADPFSGTAGTELSVDNPSWTQHSSSTVDARISNANRLRGSGASSGAAVYYHSGTPASADYSVTVDVYEASDASYGAGPCARINTGATTFYHARWYGVPNPDTVQLFKFSAGTVTQLGSDVNADFTTGTTRNLKLKCVNSGSDVLIEVYIDGSGTPIISYTDLAANTPITAAGKAGIRLGYGGATVPSDTTCLHLVNFSADDIGGGIALSSSAVASVTGAATLSVSIPIVGASAVVATGQGTLGISLALAGAGAASVVGSATLNTNQPLASSAVAGASGQGTLGIDQAISGSGVATAQGTGALGLSIPISSAALANAIGSGTLSGSAALASSAVAGVAGQGTISLSLALSSAAIANAVGSGNLGMNGALQGQGVASVSGQGTLSQAIPISGASLVATNASGTLTQIVPISANSVALANGQAALILNISMSAAALSQAIGVGDMTLKIAMNAAAVANATGMATLLSLPTPDFRTFSVKAEDRTLRVTA